MVVRREVQWLWGGVVVRRCDGGDGGLGGCGGGNGRG